MKSRLNILFCEDDDQLREFIKPLIEEAYPNSLLIMSENGLEGQEQIRTLHFDLVISDYDMKTPDGDGISLYHYYIQYQPKGKFIILTSHEESKFRSYLQSPYFKFINKGSIHSDDFSSQLRCFNFPSFRKAL